MTIGCDISYNQIIFASIDNASRSNTSTCSDEFTILSSKASYICSHGWVCLKMGMQLTNHCYSRKMIL